MTELYGKIALVTGGGRGLGEAIVRTLDAAGAIVVVGDVRAEWAERVAQDVRSNGGKAVAMKLDVTDESNVQEVIHNIQDTYQRLDILINNAGTDLTVPVEQMSSLDWDRIVSVNLRGPFITTRTAFPLMEKQGGGHIINIASTAAKRA
jgi:NAD(P)-dependent dehydrogenase (short-subunit alcohol dehydrogenase family)